MEQRYCPQCDSPCEDDAKFCKHCGASMAVSSSAAEPAPATNLDLAGMPGDRLPNPNVAVPSLPAPVQPYDVATVPHQQPVQQTPYQQPYQQSGQQNPYQQPYPASPPYPYTQGPVQQVNVVMANNATPVILVQPKSVGVALLLTFLFGPLGMFYSTVSGAVIMLIVSIVLAVFTLGLSVFITWPICMIWGAVAANTYNNTIVTRT